MPIIATAVQEELETGSASSGDATGATNTVTHNKLHHGKLYDSTRRSSSSLSHLSVFNASPKRGVLPPAGGETPPGAGEPVVFRAEREAGGTAGL